MSLLTARSEENGIEFIDSNNTVLLVHLEELDNFFAALTTWTVWSSQDDAPEKAPNGTMLP